MKLMYHFPDGVTRQWRGIREWHGKKNNLYPPKGEEIRVAYTVKFFPPVTMYWGTTIRDHSTICQNVVLREYTKIGSNTIIGTHTVCEGNVTIGNRVTVHSQCHICRDTTIEDDVFIAPFSMTLNTKRIVHGRTYPLVEDGPTIRRAARIGARVTIFPGVEIGENALVGSGSLVTKDVPAEAFVMGSPARYIREVRTDEILEVK